MKKQLMPNDERIALDLLACKKAFDNVGIPWVITDGIVLGYARNKKIMAWDDDLDLAVCVDVNNKQWKALYNSLFKEGFRINKKKADFIYGHRKIKFNLWFFYKKGNFYEAYPSTTRGMKFVEKAIWYDKPVMVDFLGTKFPMPNNMNDYLDYHYGKDWKTNIIKDHKEWFKNKRGADGKLASQPLWLKGRSGKSGDLWPKIIKLDESMEG